MTKLTPDQIKATIRACQNAENREKEHAKTMIKNYPDKKEKIEHNKDLFLLGVQTAYLQIMRTFGEI